MAKTILIIGESGSGKTTSMRNLDPATTMYIDADGKGLSWKGWRKQYIDKKNYVNTQDADVVMQALLQASKAEKVKTVVIDTLNSLMLQFEMDRIHEKGFQKWIDLADGIFKLVIMANRIKREDLTIIFTGHSETITDDAGYTFTRLKTNGRKLEKIVLESKFNIVLIAKGNQGKYIFETQANNSTAKSPMGMFDELEIENDITEVMKAMEEY